jgi:hypothetical protein
MVDEIVERARARVRAAELERANVELVRLEVERAEVPTFHESQESKWGLPPPLLDVVVSYVLGWEDRAMSAAFRAVCTTWNAAHDALCSRLAPLWDGRRQVTHEAKWLTRFPQVCFPPTPIA